MRTISLFSLASYVCVPRKGVCRPIEYGCWHLFLQRPSDGTDYKNELLYNALFLSILSRGWLAISKYVTQQHALRSRLWLAIFYYNQILNPGPVTQCLERRVSIGEKKVAWAHIDRAAMYRSNNVVNLVLFHFA